MRIADVPALAKSFLETKELVGRKGIILPKDDDAGDLARFRTEIGVPDSAEDYTLGDFAPPEGLPWSETLQTSMLAKLHEIGIPNGQIREILDSYAEVTHGEYQGMLEATSKGYEQGTAKLKQDLGADYDASLALSKRAFKSASGDQHDVLSHLVLSDGTHLGDNPAFVRTFMNVGKQFAEHGLLGEKVGGGGFTKTPDQAKEEIAVLEANPGLYNADHPEHAILVARKNELYEQAYPETPPEVL
jgi:hypothetical protein